jgi:hypothetical protein
VGPLVIGTERAPRGLYSFSFFFFSGFAKLVVVWVGPFDVKFVWASIFTDRPLSNAEFGLGFGLDRPLNQKENTLFDLCKW